MSAQGETSSNDPTQNKASSQGLHVLAFLDRNKATDRRCPQDYLADKAVEAGVELTIVQTVEDLSAALSNANIFFGTQLPASLLASSPRLRWVHSPSAGLNGVLSKELIDSSVMLTNCKGVMASEVAQHALAMVLALARGIDIAIKAQADGEWIDLRARRQLLALEGLTMVIVGYGAVGHALAERSKAFGMRIIGVRSAPAPSDDLVERIVGVADLSKVLPEADFVVLCTPGTSSTRDLIGAGEIAGMKTSAYLVNVARGDVVDELALEKALLEERIAGAASDVFVEEPLPSSHSLWQASNFIATPHVAGASQRLWYNMIDSFFDNLRRFRAREELRNLIDKSRGY